MKKQQPQSSAFSAGIRGKTTPGVPISTGCKYTEGTAGPGTPFF